MPEGNSELWNALQRGGRGPVYRRRKKHQGADWTPEKDSALSTDGAWCKSCRQRHGYMSKNALHASYEKRSGVWYILWTCIKSGNVIKDEPLLNQQVKEA